MQFIDELTNGLFSIETLANNVLSFEINNPHESLPNWRRTAQKMLHVAFRSDNEICHLHI